MKLKYLYNPRTNKIHIEGYCGYIKKYDCLSFDTEAEAFAGASRLACLCKKCQNKRDKLLQERK